MKKFKNWAVPGPLIPESWRIELDPQEAQEVSCDALSGHFKILQLKQGHRYSTDDLLVAWYGTSLCPSAHRVLDLGSGIGSVGMIAAWRLPGAQFVTIEAQKISVDLARRSAALNGLSSRYEIRQSDFRDLQALSPEESFDLILGSPPYFPLDAGILSDHEQKIACRFEARGNIDDYCQVASRHLAPGGVFSCVFPIEPIRQEDRVLKAALGSHLTVVKRRNVILKEGEKPLLGLFCMIRSDHLPESVRHQTWKEPDLVIRTRSGAIHPEYSTIKHSIGFPMP
ncbi:MAG: methyltransferase domain-containing protein [Bdellovibrionota bacterium]